METMTCPKCSHEQPVAPECARCGLIISKYRPSTFQGRDTASSIIFYDVAKGKKQLGMLLFLMLLLVFLVYRLWVTREIKYPPGIMVRSEPSQEMISDPQPWKIGERVFVPLARFSLQARVLSSERYRFDPQADIVPVDLALGWGPMSDQSVLDQLDIGQGNRRFVILTKNQASPLPMGVLLAHSSNMHMIPSDDGIKKDLCSVRTGEIIEVSGYLVGIQENGQWTLFSSLTRTDSGDGACEIVWVKRFRRIAVKNR